MWNETFWYEDILQDGIFDLFSIYNLNWKYEIKKYTWIYNHAINLNYNNHAINSNPMRWTQFSEFDLVNIMYLNSLGEAKIMLIFN